MTSKAQLHRQAGSCIGHNFVRDVREQLSGSGALGAVNDVALLKSRHLIISIDGRVVMISYAHSRDITLGLSGRERRAWHIVRSAFLNLEAGVTTEHANSI